MRGSRIIVVCVAAAWPAAIPACKDKPPGGEWVVQVEKDDVRIAKAKDEAKRRWPEFVAAFQAREPNTAYAVKAPLTSPSGKVEHMWLQVTELSETTVSGILDNVPQGDFPMKHGDPVTVPLADVEDWIIGKGAGNIVGAFSIPALREAEQERGGN